jgi:hypothetical protein
VSDEKASNIKQRKSFRSGNIPERCEDVIFDHRLAGRIPAGVNYNDPATTRKEENSSKWRENERWYVLT